MGRGVEDEGDAKQDSEVGRGRKKGGGANRKKTTDDDGTQKFQKENLHPKNGRLTMYKWTALYMSLLAHHMT